ncbi:MAG: ketoacyl-ACP synthase III [Betaproteobacteria bacterium]|nr:ketoacyl-ACP synthase III [Betaproteobacteria bacterium]
MSNLDRLSDFGLDASFVLEKLGVRQRAQKAENERTSDLCLKAVRDLQSRHSLPLGQIELLCVVTQNPDCRIPHTAAIVHQALGLAKHCMTFDVSQGCAGFTHGMAIVAAMMKSHGLQHALLLTCDPYSTIVDPADKNTALLFGDAATASYFSHEGPGYVLCDIEFGTVPGSADCLRCEERLQMDGRAVLMNAAHEVPASIQTLLHRNGLATSDIEAFLFHPGSRRIIELLRSDLSLDEDRTPFDVEQHGNTVSSSIPLMLADRFPARRGAKLVLSGFGVGFTWASNLIEFL